VHQLARERRATIIAADAAAAASATFALNSEVMETKPVLPPASRSNLRDPAIHKNHARHC
jgi:hypothetical protein